MLSLSTYGNRASCWIPFKSWSVEITNRVARRRRAIASLYQSHYRKIPTRRSFHHLIASSSPLHLYHQLLPCWTNRVLRLATLPPARSRYTTWGLCDFFTPSSRRPFYIISLPHDALDRCTPSRTTLSSSLVLVSSFPRPPTVNGQPVSRPPSRAKELATVSRERD